MRIPRVQFTIRRMMIVVALFAILFTFIDYETVGSFYGPGGELDREYAEAERVWKSEHPGQPYPTNPPASPSR